jgi:hypothetical protein
MTPQGDEDFEQYVKRAADDHALHRLTHIAISLWAGWVWGWLWSLAVFAGLFLIIAACNLALLALTGNMRLIHVNRWAWLWIALAGIMLSSASFRTV